MVVAVKLNEMKVSFGAFYFRKGDPPEGGRFLAEGWHLCASR